MRTITFKRKKTFYCCLLKVCCAIEKYPVAIIKNGEEITIEIDDDYHELFLMDCYSGLKISNSLTMPQNENVTYTIKPIMFSKKTFETWIIEKENKQNFK